MKGKNRRLRRAEQVEALSQSDGRWFMHIEEFRVSVDDGDDIGCTFYADSREDVRNVVKKVKALQHIVVPGIKKIKWAPELIALGFKCWNHWDTEDENAKQH